MPDVIGQRLAGSIIYVDKNQRRRIYDAIGPNVIKFHDRFIKPLLTAADAPVDYTITLVEAGAGESTITKPDGVDSGLLFTTDAAASDGVNMQLKGEPFKLNASCQALYFYARLQASEATQIAWLVGLCITDTTLIGGMTDGVYFKKADDATTMTANTDKNSTITSTNCGAFAAATDVELEFFYDKNTGAVEFYVNGTLVATHTTNIVDDEDITPSLQVITGEAVSHTLTLKEMRAIQIGY
jgi:hypothetical protein